MTALQAIRAKCLDCCCGNTAEVTRCPCVDCSLYPYREGHNPFKKKREYTDEQREEQRQRLKANLAKKTDQLVEQENF